ncbi:MAG: glycosyltransferase family 2 protein [Clostridia bacterium]|nr:glycosyltransferase family 2 protein [Clostridia bacterium]
MKPTFSVIIPAFNEQEVLEASFQRIDAVMREMGEPYELIFVNDGSRDRTRDILQRLAREHSCVRALHLSRNFGQQNATTAGLGEARGDAMVIIDCDLQDPPEVIPEMVKKWRDGEADIVYGKRTKREGETALKRLTSWGFYRTMNALTGFPIPEDTGDFRLMSRASVDAFLAMPERNRYLRGMFAWVGFRQGKVQFHRDKRFAGETKYSYAKMVRLALDGMISFSIKPLVAVLVLGLLLCAVGVIWLLGLLMLTLFGRRAGLSFSALAALMVFLSGLAITSVGIIGAYVGRIYDEAKGRPLYVIAERDGFGAGRNGDSR